MRASPNTGRINRALKRAWIPLVLVVVLALSAAGRVAATQDLRLCRDLNANAGAGIEIVQFNPKVVKYEGLRPARDQREHQLLGTKNANTHQVNAAPLPWSTTISTTLPSVSANIMAQGDGNQISCKITVDGVVREQQNADGHNAQTFCLVKSA